MMFHIFLKVPLDQRRIFVQSTLLVNSNVTAFTRYAFLPIETVVLRFVECKYHVGYFKYLLSL